LDLATVAVSPALWPPKVALLQPFSFPILLNGRVAGQARAPAGTLLRLVRINGQEVEIEFQNVRHSIPALSTDLMQRALQRLQTGASVPPQYLQQAATVRQSDSPVPARVARTSTDSDTARLAQRLSIETIPKKTTRIEGGDFDDKKDRFTLKVKFTNTDTALVADSLKAEIFIFGESILDRSIRKVLATEEFTFSLPAHGVHEVATKEVATAYDKTGAKFGFEYEGWFLRVRNSSGAIITVKASLPTLLKSADKIVGLKVDGQYDRNTFAENKTVLR
jgi:hypothetical protein